MKKVIIIGILILILLLIIGWYFLGGSKNGAINYKLSKLEKGDIIQEVSATGVIQPITLVQIGTQVSGPVKKLYADYNSRIKMGDLLAQIDPAVFSARMDQDIANLIRSEAEVERVKANLNQAENELKRSQELTKRDLISQSELDSAIANRDSLLAQLKVALASVEQSKATLQVSKTNLEYTTIKSPIDGIVISRNVDEGQTVAASLSAPTLFVIANDLKKIQVQASISEADIGKIKTGQRVKFRVDAYTETEFIGAVEKIYLSATTVQNVVTYTVIINADNPEEKLMPGMTANLTCEVASRINVLKLPNAALRFSPEPGQIIEEAPTEPDKTAVSPANRDKQTPAAPGPRETGNQRQRRGQGQEKDQNQAKSQQIWVKANGGVKAVMVKTGITDNSFTEIVESNLKEGDEVITGTLQKGQINEMVNPFTPRIGGPGRRIGH